MSTNLSLFQGSQFTLYNMRGLHQAISKVFSSLNNPRFDGAMPPPAPPFRMEFACKCVFCEVSPCGRSVYSLYKKKTCLQTGANSNILTRTCDIYPEWKIPGVHSWGGMPFPPAGRWGSSLGGKGGKLACPLAKLLSENSLLLDTAYSYQGCPCLTPNYAIKKLATSFGCIQPCAFWYLLINCPVSSWKEPWGWSYCSDLLHTWKDTGNKEKRLMYWKHAWELDFFRRHKKAEKMLKILEHRVAT